MKRRTSRCFTCKKDNSYFIRYLKNPSIMPLAVFLVVFIMIFCWRPVCRSISLSLVYPYFGSRMITWVNINGFSPNLVTCNDIVEVSFEIANGQILSIFDIGICPSHDNGGVLSFHMFIFLYFQVLILLNTQKYFVFLGAVLPRPVSWEQICWQR